MMTIEEAILHAEERAKEASCKECADQHRQLALWLRELKMYRERFGSILKICPEIAQDYTYRELDISEKHL